MTPSDRLIKVQQAQRKVKPSATMKPKRNWTKHWLGERLNMGGLKDVRRQVAVFQRETSNANDCPFSSIDTISGPARSEVKGLKPFLAVP